MSHGICQKYEHEICWKMDLSTWNGIPNQKRNQAIGYHFWVVLIFSIFRSFGIRIESRWIEI